MNGLIVAAIFAAPWCVQNILYLFFRFIFRKSKKNHIYTICFFINCIVLFIIFRHLSPKTLEDSFDAFNDFLLLLIWCPSFIVVVISCIARNAAAKEKSDEETIEKIMNQMKIKED